MCCYPTCFYFYFLRGFSTTCSCGYLFVSLSTWHGRWRTLSNISIFVCFQDRAKRIKKKLNELTRFKVLTENSEFVFDILKVSPRFYLFIHLSRFTFSLICRTPERFLELILISITSLKRLSSTVDSLSLPTSPSCSSPQTAWSVASGTVHFGLPN